MPVLLGAPYIVVSGLWRQGAKELAGKGFFGRDAEKIPMESVQ
jgi:hypothetical protein